MLIKQFHPLQTGAPNFDILIEYIAKVETDVQIKTSGMSSQWT